MNLRHLLRLARWARRPASAQRVVLVLALLGLCLAIAAAEWAGLLPDWFATTVRFHLPKPKLLG